jgi:hypothetical protein
MTKFHPWTRIVSAAVVVVVGIDGNRMKFEKEDLPRRESDGLSSQAKAW